MHDFSFTNLLENGRKIMVNEDFMVKNPDVLITIEGLALFCYKESKEEWQVVFPEDEHHQLGIKICRHDKQNKNGKCEPYYQVKKGTFGDGNKRKVSVSAHGEKWIESGKSHFEGVSFSWVNYVNNDKRDFRYIVDLENKYLTHGKQKKLKNDSVIRLSLEHTFLYTYDLPAGSYVLYDEQLINPTRKILHKVGKIVGGNIIIDPKAADANVKLKIEGYDDPPPLVDFSRYRYKINFNNDCPTKILAEKDEKVVSCDSDFPIYYTLVNPQDSDDKCRYNLKRKTGTKGRIDCDAAWMSQSDSLF